MSERDEFGGIIQTDAPESETDEFGGIIQPKPQGYFAGAANKFAQDAVKGVGSAAVGLSAATSLLPLIPMGDEEAPQWMLEENARRAARTPTEKLSEIKSGAAYEFGNAASTGAEEAYPVSAENEKNKLTKVAGSLGGFLPLIGSGPLAPVTIGIQSLGSHIENDFNMLKESGMSDEDAAKTTLDRALLSGVSQATLFALLPKPLKMLGEKYLLSYAEKPIAKFLANRAVEAGEGAVLGGTSAVAENAVSDRPLLENVGESALSLALLNAGQGAAVEGGTRGLNAAIEGRARAKRKISLENYRNSSMRVSDLARRRQEMQYGDITDQIMQAGQTAEKGQNAVPIGSTEATTLGETSPSSEEVGGQVRDAEESAVPQVKEGEKAPDQSAPEIKPPTGDIAVTIQRPDGSTYQAGFNGWQVSDMKRGPDGNPVPTQHIAILSVLKPGDDKWSTGVPLPEGDKIINAEKPVPDKPKLTIEGAEALLRNGTVLTSGLVDQNGLADELARRGYRQDRNTKEWKYVQSEAAPVEKPAQPIIQKEPLASGQTEISRDQALAIHGGSKKLLPKPGETKPQPSDTSGEYFVGQTKDGRFFTEQRPKENRPANDVPPEQSASKPGEASPTVAQPAAEVKGEKKRVARGVSRSKVFDNETELSGDDILSWIKENGRLLSKSAAKEKKGKEWWQANKSLYDDAVTLQRPHHNLIYAENGSYPDQVAQAAYEAGKISSPSERDLWAAIDEASKNRAAAFENRDREAKLLDEAAQEHVNWVKATEAGAIRVTPEDLQVGDVMEVDGERVKVTAKDPDNGDLTLEDGRKFGRQVLKDGQSIHVEKLEQKGEESADFLPPEEKPKPAPLPQKAMRPLTKKEQAEFQVLSEKAKAARESGGEGLTSAETRRYQDLEALAGAQDLLAEPAGANEAAERAEIARLRRKAEQLDKLAISARDRSDAANDPDNRDRLWKEHLEAIRQADLIRNEANKRERALGGSGKTEDLALEQEIAKEEATKPVEEDLFSQKPKAQNEPVPSAQKEEAVLTPQKYRVGKNPQTLTLLETLPQSKSEKELGEQYVRLKNDKTGEEGVYEVSTLTPVKERTAEQKADEKAGKRDLDKELRALKLDPSEFPNDASKRDAIKRAKAKGEEPQPNLGNGLPEGQGMSLESVLDATDKEDSAGFNSNVVSRQEAVSVTGRPEAAGYAGFFWKGEAYLVHDNISDANEAKQIFREEIGHGLLRTEAGGRLLKEVLDKGQLLLTEAEKQKLRDEGYGAANLLDEFIAKSAREKQAWWKAAVERVRVWLSKAGLVDLTNAEVARLLLRNIRRAVKNETIELPADAISGEISPAISKLRQAVRQFPEAEAENRTEAERNIRLGQAGEIVGRKPIVQEILRNLEAQANPATPPATALGRAQRDISRKVLTNGFVRRALRVPVETLNESRSLVGGAMASFADVKADPRSTPGEISAAAGNALNGVREFERRAEAFDKTYLQKRQDIVERVTATAKAEMRAMDYQERASVLLDDLNELAVPLIRQTKDAEAIRALSIVTDRNRTRAVQNVMRFISDNVEVEAMSKSGIGNAQQIFAEIRRQGGSDYNARIGASDDVIQAVSRVLAYSEPIRERLQQARDLTWLKGQNEPFNRYKTRIVDAIIKGDYIRAMQLFTRTTQATARQEGKYSDAASFYGRRTKALLTSLQALDESKRIADTIRNDPEFKAEKKQVYDELNVRDVLFDHRGTSLVFKPLNEGEEPLVVTFGNDSRKTNEVLGQLSAYKQKALAILADESTEPARANAIKASLPVIDNLLDPSIRPEAARLLPNYLFLPVRTFLGLLGRPEQVPYYVLQGAGGPASAMADASLAALRTMGEQRQRIFTQHEPQLQITLAAALKSHGGIDPETYRTRVWNALVGSRQNFNDIRKLTVGSPIGNGEVVTAADIAYMQRYAEFHRDFQDVVNNVANRQFVSFKQVLTGILYDRNGRVRMPFAAGDTTLARRIPDQVSKWLETWGQSKTPEEKIEFLNRNFDRLVIGYVDGTSRADWSGKFSYAFANEIKSVISEFKDNPMVVFEDLIDRVRDKYNSRPDLPPESMLTTAEVRDRLLGDFDKIFKRLEIWDKNQQAIDPKRTLQMFGGDNAFNTERGNVVMPPGWYDYGGVTNGDWSSVGTVAMQPFYLAHLASVEQLNNALTDTIKNFELEGKRLGNREVSKASSKARVRGDLIYSWADAKELAKEVGEYLTKLRRLTEEPHLVTVGDRPQVVMTSGAIQLTMSSILALPQTMFRNFGGQMNAVIGDRIVRNQSFPVAVARHGAYFVRDAFQNTLNLLAHEGNPVGRKVYSVLNDAQTKPIVGQVAKLLMESINARRELYKDSQELALSLQKNLSDSLAGMRQFYTTGGSAKPRESQSRIVRGLNAFSTGTRMAARIIGQSGVGYVDAWLNTGGLSRASDYEQHFKRVAQKFAPVIEELALKDGRDPFNAQDPLNVLPDKAFGSVQRALFVRTFFRRGATINLDSAILDYYRRWKDAAPEDKPNVDLFTQDQFNELAIANAEDFNLATFSNRPISTKLSGLNSKMGLLLGYPAWSMHKFLSYVNTTSRKPGVKAIAQNLPFAIATGAALASMSILVHDAYERIKNLLMGKYGAYPTISQARTPGAFVRAGAAAVADDMPFYGLIAWQLFSLGYNKKFSIEDSLFLMSYAKDIFNTGKEVYETHDPVRPLLALLGRYVAPFNLGVGRLPLFAGSQEVTNAKNLLKNSVRAKGDDDLLKEPAGADEVKYTLATPFVNRAINAIGNGDMTEFMRQYAEIVRVKAEEGSRDPEADARKLISSRNPIGAVFKKLPDPAQLETYISSLPSGQQDLVHKQLQNYQQASELIGIGQGGSSGGSGAPAGGAGGGSMRLPSAGGSGRISLGSRAIGKLRQSLGRNRLKLRRPTAKTSKIGRLRIGQRSPSIRRLRLPRIKA